MSSPGVLRPDELLEQMKSNFTGGQRRRTLPGLLISFIEFFRALDALDGKYASMAAFHSDYPLITIGANGKGVNTLTVRLPTGKTLSIRRFYDKIANWFRADQKRFDYPSSAPHSTQAWGDYFHWLSALLTYTPEEIAHLESEAKQFVLRELPSQDIDPSSVRRDPSRFLLFLEEFDMKAQKGETTGAAYQGTVFGYIRADAPHLQVEVGKVRAGSKREKRVGDIDARDGADLVMSAEVKQFKVKKSTLPDLAEFAHLIAKHKALGLVVALEFDEGMGDELLALGLVPISKADLISRVRVWDPLKQRIAMNAVLYYVGFREQSSALYGRIKAFLDKIDEAVAKEP